MKGGVNLAIPGPTSRVISHIRVMVLTDRKNWGGCLSLGEPRMLPHAESVLAADSPANIKTPWRCLHAAALTLLPT